MELKELIQYYLNKLDDFSITIKRETNPIEKEHYKREKEIAVSTLKYLTSLVEDGKVWENE